MVLYAWYDRPHCCTSREYVKLLRTALIVTHPTLISVSSVKVTMKLQILYGGELAQSVSEGLIELAKADSHEVTVFDMKDFKKANLDSVASYTVFILQTIENDQAPESAARMFSFLKNKSHPTDMFSKLHFAVIGLGDSNLLQDRQTTTGKDCNHCGQTINKRLKDLGGVMIHDLCEADERTELEEVEPWMVSFFKTLATSSS